MVSPLRQARAASTRSRGWCAGTCREHWPTVESCYYNCHMLWSLPCARRVPRAPDHAAGACREHQITRLVRGHVPRALAHSRVVLLQLSHVMVSPLRQARAASTRSRGWCAGTCREHWPTVESCYYNCHMLWSLPCARRVPRAPDHAAGACREHQITRLVRGHVPRALAHSRVVLLQLSHVMVSPLRQARAASTRSRGWCAGTCREHWPTVESCYYNCHMLWSLPCARRVPRAPDHAAGACREHQITRLVRGHVPRALAHSRVVLLQLSHVMVSPLRQARAASTRSRGWCAGTCREHWPTVESCYYNCHMLWSLPCARRVPRAPDHAAGACREHQITRLVRGHVPRAEKARRHGRELSYILPHYAVHLFPPLFHAIELEIRDKTNRLGITSYGVSMTTLEEVFLSLEGENEEETEAVEGLSSVKLVRARALSRSLSLQSKTLSYQELNDKDQQKTPSLPTPPASHALHSTNHGVEHVKVTPEAPVSVDALGEIVKTNPSCWRTFCALVYIRTVRMIRDPYKLYVMIFMPIISCALGLYMKSRQIVFFRMQPLKLDPNAYFNKTPIALYSEQDNFKEIIDFKDSLESLGAHPIDLFDGNFSSLLDMENFGAFSLKDSLVPLGKIMAYYNSTYTHSLPIIINLLDNSIYRVLMAASDQLDSFKPIEILTHPFQQTEQQEEFNLGNVVCAIFMGMIFALVPVTLAVDIVYDREIKAKNQLRVNGLSMSMYFLTYFTILIFIMMVTSAGVLVLVILNDIPSLTNGSAIIMLSGLLLLYSPSAILFNTCLSYIFDKMDSAQSIMPNITTWVGVIPFILVAVLDTFKWGSDIAFYLHLVFSFLDVMYIPYAIIYYVDRVYLTCNLRGLCTVPSLSSYFTAEVWVLIVAMLVHVPVCGAALLAADRLKSGGRICPRAGGAPRQPDGEAEAGGDAREDDDVRRERRRVAALLAARGAAAPALLVHNLRKEYKLRDERSGAACCGGGEAARRAALARLSLAVHGGEVFGLLGHNGAGKTTTMKIITAEERLTCGTVMLGGQNIEEAQSSAFQMLGYCPQHDALWKNVTIREHLECYAAIRGISKADTPRIVEAYLQGLQIAEHAGKNAEECSGGTRRKLSFALAMVGSPRVVLLDEPSTGMDPRSKRFLWDTILASFQGRKGAILTTHSMEEADALCSRVGIMVKGGLRCIGSTQHLKNLYGAGYTLEMKIGQQNQKNTMVESDMSLSPSPLRSANNSPSLGEADEGSGGGSQTVEGDVEGEGEGEAVDVSIHTPLVGNTPSVRLHHQRTESGGGASAEAAIALVAQLFPAAVLEESFAERLVFSVPQSSVSSLASCFQQIEDAKEKLNIVEYSFSQTTLEQVFLKFAQSENVESSDQEH
ncbi:unnamed protein product [Euphydryas editha]|uniref:ABC transporter domain-containing protein n=1 Tax=Euphydryas editha TaxID=104508 RepID=A0AAU9U5L4_EUPED|nr:unnamed protein product [Euphydryas editha]